MVGLFLVFYGLFRISLENVREPDRGMPNFPFGLTMGIMLSIPMVLAGLAFLYYSRKPSALAAPWTPEDEDEAGEADTTLKDVPEIAVRTPSHRRCRNRSPPKPPRRMSLKAKLARRIAATGPITVAEFMTACLHDPEHGYYATRPAIGAEGDFITAPMISQMFGELIGLWAVECWTQMGRPAPFRLIEMGPGDGTLMSDMLRAARLAPDFRAAAELWLVETSVPLRAMQQRALADQAPRWASSLDDVPHGAPIGAGRQRASGLPARPPVRSHRERDGRNAWSERMRTAA